MEIKRWDTSKLSFETKRFFLNGDYRNAYECDVNNDAFSLRIGIYLSIDIQKGDMIYTFSDGIQE